MKRCRVLHAAYMLKLETQYGVALCSVYDGLSFFYRFFLSIFFLNAVCVHWFDCKAQTARAVLPQTRGDSQCFPRSMVFTTREAVTCV